MGYISSKNKYLVEQVTYKMFYTDYAGINCKTDMYILSISASKDTHHVLAQSFYRRIQRFFADHFRYQKFLS